MQIRYGVSCTGKAWTTCLFGMLFLSSAVVRVLAIDVSGTISTNTFWTMAGSHYRVTANITVAPSATLTIAPGVVVQFNQYQGMYVDGRLVAIGTSEAPITFTGSETPGSWGAIQVQNAGSAALDWCTLSYGGNNTYSYWGGNQGVRKSGSGNLAITRSTINKSAGYGLAIVNSSGTVALERSAFSTNSASGVYLNNSSVTATGCTFVANADYGLLQEVNDGIVYTGNLFTNNGTAGVGLNGGTRASNWILSPAGNPFRITGNISIATNATLTIEPGVLVQVNQYQGLYVDGQLNATGTALAPITFTGSTETPDWWGGLRIQNAGSAALDWCDISYGGNNTYSFWGGNNNIYKTGTGSLAIRHSTVRNSAYEGLRVAAGYSAFVSASNTFCNNGRYGVAIGINASFDDNTSDFSSNGSVDAYIDQGTISQPVVFSLKPDYSFYVSYNLAVATNGTLTIQPGTVLKFAQYAGISVDGTLTALGTSSKPIFFTDYRDDASGGDANKDGTNSLPAANWWGAIQVQNAGSADLDWCTLSYGGNNTYSYWGGNQGLRKSGSGNLTITRSTINKSAGYGLAIVNSSGTVALDRSAFSTNSASGVYLKNSPVTATGCTFVANADYGLLQEVNDGIVYTGNLFTNNGTAGVGLIGGTRASNWILSPAGNPFRITGNISIATNATLTIEPGVLVQVNQYQGLYVDGQLNATGTALAPITFTGSTETPNWWGGLRIQNAGSATLDWCVIRYGGNNTYSFWGGNNNIYKTGTGSLTLRHSTLRDSSYEGLRVAAGYSAFVSASNTFCNNGRYGVAIGINASFDDNTSDFSSNGSVDAYIDQGTISQPVVFSLKPDYSFYVSYNLAVATNGTLTIQPGTVMKFAQYSGVYVDGTLTALGTSSKPIFFTDYRDDASGGDVNKDSTNSLPAANWWGAIQVQNAGSAALDWCTLSYGGNNTYSYWGGNQGVRKSGSGNLAITRCTINKSAGYGLAIVNSSGTVALDCSAFSTNSASGVYLNNGPVTATGCTFVANADYGLLQEVNDGIVYTGNLFTNNGTAGVGLIGGTRASNWILSPAGNPFRITGNISIATNATLTIEPGVLVQVNQYQGLYVDGQLNATGTALAPITFTGSTETPNWWGGLRIQNAGSATLDWCVVRYGGNNTYSFWGGNNNIYKTGTGSLTLRHSTLRDSSYEGLRVAAGYAAFVSASNTFRNNGRYGVAIGINASFDDNSSDFANNASVDALLDAGTISQSVVFRLKPDYSFYVNGNLTVASSGTLTILPGTVVKFPQYCGIFVDGTLTALGTSSEPIFFTDVRDDAVGGDANKDGADSLPAPNWWGAIRVQNAGSAALERCNLRYGGNNSYGNWGGNNGVLKSGSGDLSLRNTAVSQTYGAGLAISASAGAHLISECAFSNNVRGVEVAAGQTKDIALTNCAMVSNSSYGVLNSSVSCWVDALGCWWGDESGPYHATLNAAGKGDKVSARVRFDPWRVRASSCRILSPARSGTLVAGDMLRFTGAELGVAGPTYLWNFGSGRTFAVHSPGLVNFPQTGSVAVAYSATDDGSVDPFPDSRAYTVVPDTGTIPDLRVVSVSVPASLAVGQSAQISYTVRNAGQGAASGAWRDAVYLSDDANLDVLDTRLTAVSVNRTVAVGDSYQNSITVTLPAVEEKAYYLILVANEEWQLLERSRLNNEYAAPFTAQIPALTEGVAFAASYDAGRVEQYYRMTATSGRNLLLNSLNVPVGLEVYIRFGTLPTRGAYDYRLAAGDRLLIPAAAAGDWYILVYGDMGAAGQYQFEFDLEAVVLTQSLPTRHGTGTELDLTLTGAGFITPLGVALVSANSTVFAAYSVEVDSFTQATAKFLAGSVPAGTYAVRISRNGQTAQLTNALQVVADGAAKFDVQLILPARFGYHMLSTVYVEYANTGDAPMAAPLLLVSATQKGRAGAIMTLDQTRLSQGFWSAAMPEGFANSVQFMASGDTPGVIQPGESRRVPVYYAGWQQPWDFGYPAFDWNVGVLEETNQVPVNWDGMKAGMRPDYIRTDAWDVVWSNFKAQTGTTWGDYVAMLSRNALYLQRQGQRVENIESLLAFTFRQADGLCPIPVLASGMDSAVQSAGFPIVFERTYLQQISRRFERGPMGRGWTHNWQFALSVKSDGTVTVTGPSGTPRIFQPDSRYAGSYLAQPGDQGSLRSVGGGFRLTEANGTVQFFLADGKLDYIEDANGNRVTCNYSSGQLTGLSHTSGGSLQIAYNVGGCVASVTDHLGRQTGYTYDGDYLAAVRAYDGRTTTYRYQTASGASQHSLSAIGLPDGTIRVFTYDERGRLTGAYRDNQEEKITFTHADIGRVNVMDALGHTTKYFFDFWSRVVKVENALGEAVQKSFDDLGHLTSVTDPDGLSSTFAYDRSGNLAVISDAMRHSTRFTYTRAPNRVATVTDALNNRTDYRYDSRGNLTVMGYADGSLEQWGYDGQGNSTVWTNRRGRAVSFGYDTAGRITRKTYADASIVTYNYDGRGNLSKAVDSYGTNTFTYSTNDYLTRIDYPGGRWLSFGYDAVGRRTSTLDHLSYQMNCQYDAAGRLSRLSDGVGDIVQYAYDPLGRLERKTMGNGVYSIQTYDGAGRLTSMTNCKPDHSVLSSFAYTYDRRGRRTAMQAHYGTWTYQYDDVGQLTRAELVSTAGDIQDQVLAYTYDALGNRVRTTVNGQGEDYDVNSLNQYTQVGASTNTYDLDGNLIRQEGPNGATVYTYDDSKRLVGVTRGGTNWTYRYDPLGNRVAEDENGAVTHYVFDPVGLGNVVGEYNANGTQRARYTHGAGLVRRSAAADGIHYYTFDPMGNVSEMTGAAGAPQNAYAYRPFGETLRQDQLAPNPFKFMGQLGVMADNTGLYSMRARQYDPRLGRFTAMDPIGLGGGDANLYRYALNSPTHLVDPSGLAKCALSQEEADARWDKEFSTFTPEEYAKALKKIGYEAGKGRWSYGMNVVGMGISGVGGYLIETPAGVPLIAIGGVIALAPDVYFGVKESWRNYWNPPSADTLKVFCAINKHPVPPPTPPAKSGRNGASGSAGPQDPNRKISVAGFGTNNFVKADTLLPYRIEFENDKSALSPAQVVQISDPLAPQLDWNSFAITEVGFGNVLVQVQPGLNYYETVLDYAYADTNYDFQIEVHVKVWLENGQVYANFLSIDPDTGMPPPDVNTGFLMPEDGTGRGQGHVAFTFRPKPDLPSGTAIRNVATIQFDFGQKIDTDQVAPLDPGQGKDPAKQALVTFDAIAPSSSVAALTNNVPLEFPVSWAGQDDEHGSGIAGYDIYVRKNNGQWNLWLTNTPQISAVYTGAYAQAFSFYSVAIDNVGYAESKQAQAEASTVVELGGVRFAEETVSVSESDGVVALTIIGGKEGETNSAGYWILPGTATAGSDYTPPKTQPQRLTWTNTHGSQTIIIPITMDALIEDDETFYVLLGSPVGGEIGKERVCQVTITDANRSDTLADALDNVLLKWTTGGTPGWVPQNNVTFDGEDAAASGAMASNKASYVQTSVTGAGTLCFVWSVTNNGVLRLLDGTKVLAAVTNTTAWQNRSLSLTNTAAHPLKWEFTQGSSTNGRAYLDQVVWLPGGKTGVTVTAKANNPAGGTVSGSGVYYTGAAVPLNAKPRPGWLFTGWTPTNRFTKPLLTAQMLTVSNSAINVTANFAEIPVVTGLPRPPEGGAVTGSGLCLPGKSVTLKATAAKNWWFMGWSDGVQISSRTITASRDVTLCAEFKLISEIASPVIGNLGAPKAVVGVAFSLPVQVTSETLPTVTVTGLPAGLKYDAAAKLITGVPTAAGSNTAVTVTAKNVKATVTQPFSMTVDLLPLWASGAFNGWCELGSNDRGVATMAVTKPGKVTGKFSAGGSNYTFSAASYAAGSNPTDGFSLTANAAAGKAVMPLRLTVSYAATGSLSVANGSGLVMYRNVWNDPDRTATATNLNGYYTATLPGDDTFGSGYLACTLSKGVVNAAGKLADGTAVSLSSTLLVDESSRCFAVLYTAPTTYKGGSLFGVAEFLGFTNGGSAVFVHPVHDIPFVWENRNPLATSINGAGFIRELGLVGGRYGNLVDLSAYYANKTLTVGTGSTHAPETSGVGTTNRYEAVYWNPAGLPLTVVTNRSGLITGIMAPKVAQPVNMGNNSWSYPAAPTNTVGLTLTLNPATGLFQGSYHAWFDYAVAHTLKSIGFAGLLTPKRENMADSIEGRGFFLWADKATYTNQPGTYPFNWSYDFVIRSE